MLAAGVSELRNAFWQHTDMREQSQYLLLFYAVECGLKAEYLRRMRLRTTEEIGDEELRGTHDLRRLAKELRLPANLISDLSFLLQKDKSRWQINKAHEAWRYGLAILSEKSLEAQLRDLQQWLIKEGMGR